MEEISSENLAELNKRYRSTVFIVLAQIAVTIALIAAVWFVPARTQSSISQQTSTTLWMAIIFVALGTFLLRRMFFRWDRLKDIVLLKGVPGLLATLQTNAIILAAMAEIVSVTGFMIAVLSGEKFEMLRAGLVALIVFLINFPRKAVWGKVAAKLQEV